MLETQQILINELKIGEKSKMIADFDREKALEKLHITYLETKHKYLPQSTQSTQRKHKAH